MKLSKILFASLALVAAPIGALAMMSGSAFAAVPFFYTQKDNVALGGYDAVSYFTGAAPVQGVAEHSTEYKGAIFRFASAENLAKFQASPDAYAPQFGGYCAYGAALGHAAPTEASTGTIVNGKLYLNYNHKVKDRWAANKDAYIADANSKWEKIRTEGEVAQ